MDQWAATATIDWDLGWASLASVTGTIELDRFFHIDVDAGPADQFDFFQTDTVQQVTQELRLAGSGDTLDWLIGAFWSADDVGVDTNGLHQDLIPGEMSHIDADQTTRCAAGFVNLDWRFAVTLALTGGLRYTYEARDYVGGSTWTVNIPGAIEDTFIDAGIEDRNWSWKLGLNYTPIDDALIYGNVSKGVKSGGFVSGVTTNQAQLQPYKPEELIAYEIGAKTQGALSLNASAFYYDYTNVQVFMRSASAPVQLIGNVEDAEVYGADFDARWLLGDSLTLQGGLGLLRSKLGAFADPSGNAVPGQPPPQIPEGNELANAPALTFNALVRYELPFLFALRSALQADAHYSDEVFKEATNNTLIKAEAYWIYNARVSVFAPDAAWELALWGRNLSDEEYVVQGLDIGAFFIGNRNYNAPRTFGAELSVHF
ncbi:MAG: TonB-dependent receptor domain-containing protein [Gammaproteobacteria bacterium]